MLYFLEIEISFKICNKRSTTTQPTYIQFDTFDTVQLGTDFVDAAVYWYNNIILKR